MITRKDLSEEQENALQHMLNFVKGSGRQMVLAGYAGTGKCLSGDSIIWKADGLVRLKSLSSTSQKLDTAIDCNINVLGFDKTNKKIRPVEATQVWRDSKTDGFEFTLNKGYVHSVSSWHPIYCEIDGVQDYFKSCDIHKAHLEGKSIWFPMVNGHSNWNVEDTVTVTTDRFTVSITSEIAYVLGFLVGDGSLTQTTLNTTRFSNIDSDIILALTMAGKTFDNEFGIKTVSGTSCDWIITSPVLCDLIRYMNINVTSDLKTIPNSIIESPRKVISSFISGLFDADGHSDKRDGYIEYCTTSKRLSIDVHNVLLAFGVISKRKFRSNNCKGSWNIYIRGSHAKTFYSDIGFRCIRKQINENLLTNSFNTNDQLYPPTIVPLMEQLFKSRSERGVVDDLLSDKMLRYGVNNRKMSSYYVDYYQGKRTPSISKLNEFLVDVAGEGSSLHDYCKDGKFWLKLENASHVELDLYDLVVPETHSFIANGTINHNTTLVRVFLKELKKVRKYADYYCTAPTNEAVRVIAKSTGEDFDSTIYSLLGLALIEEEGEAPRLIQRGKPKLEEYDVIILDECSMIGDELLFRIEEQLQAHPKIKMIYVGDSGQLPPINTDRDIKKGNEQTESKVFQLKDKIELVSVQRVTEGNPIIGVVTPIRTDFSSPIDLFERDTILCAEETGVEFHDNRDAMLEMMYNDFLSDEYKADNNYVRAVAFTNRAIDAMNLHIRRRIFDTKELDQFMVGENLIAGSPVFERINKYLSDMVINSGERLRVTKARCVQDPEYGFDVWKLSVVTYEEDNPESYDIKVIDQNSNAQYRAVLAEFATEAKERLLKTMMVGGVEKPIYSRKEAWKDYYKFKEEFSWVKYSYAMTTHKSQGSTIERVYVIERDLNILTWNDIIRNKLKYTSFTRASKLLRILQ